MTNLSAYSPQECQPLRVNYQQELAFASKEIQSALKILESSQEITQTDLQLTEKIRLVNRIVTKVTQRLQNLEEQLKLLKDQGNSVQISQTQEVQQVISQKLEDIKKTVNFLQYSA